MSNELTQLTFDGVTYNVETDFPSKLLHAEITPYYSSLLAVHQFVLLDFLIRHKERTVTVEEAVWLQHVLSGCGKNKTQPAASEADVARQVARALISLRKLKDQEEMNPISQLFVNFDKAIKENNFTRMGSIFSILSHCAKHNDGLNFESLLQQLAYYGIDFGTFVDINYLQDRMRSSKTCMGGIQALAKQLGDLPFERVQMRRDHCEGGIQNELVKIFRQICNAVNSVKPNP